MNKKIIFSCCLFLSFFGAISQIAEVSLFEKKQFIKELDTLQYRILYPLNFSEEKVYPLVLFLHGAGERESDNETQLTHGSALFLTNESRTNFPAIVVFPQCPKNDYWANLTADRTTKPITFEFKNGEKPTKSLGLVIGLLDDLLTKSYTNKKKVYVMGLSMGGMGTFEILNRKPTTFAAAIPICGGGSPETTASYATTTALWIFHGAKDDVVSPQLSIGMVSGILNAGGNPNFTLYSNDNHNSWDSAFAEPNLLPWLFSKK